MREVLEQLAVAADEPLTAVGSACGTAVASVEASPFSGNSVPVAAEMTGLSQRYIRRLAKDKKIRCDRIGRDWLIDMDSLRSVTGRTGR